MNADVFSNFFDMSNCHALTLGLWPGLTLAASLNFCTTKARPMQWLPSMPITFQSTTYAKDGDAVVHRPSEKIAGCLLNRILKARTAPIAAFRWPRPWPLHVGHLSEQTCTSEKCLSSLSPPASAWAAAAAVARNQSVLKKSSSTSTALTIELSWRKARRCRTSAGANAPLHALWLQSAQGDSSASNCLRRAQHVIQPQRAAAQATAIGPSTSIADLGLALGMSCRK
jgi:hypothetical protein